MSERVGLAAAYLFALRHWFLFTVLYLSVQVVAYALVLPASGALARLAVSGSGQSALTDQDMAQLLLHPVGLVAALALFSVLLVAQVLGFALAAAAIGTSGRPGTILRAAYARVAARLGRLLVFAALFVGRTLLIAAPFAALAFWIFLCHLTEYDINHYLSNRPPEFLRYGALIALVLAAGAALLVARLSGWALSVHLLLFTDTPPARVFAESVARMQGQRLTILLQTAGWVLVGLALASGIALVTGIVANLIPLGGSLNLALGLALVIALAFTLANLVAGAVSIAALARLVGGHFRPRAPVTPAPPPVPLPTLLLLGALAAAGLLGGTWLLGGVPPRDTVEIIAHRGGALHGPENSLAAIRKGIEAGADWIEIDVQESADGEVVVIHDSDFMKLAGVDLKIWDATLDDLAAIDIGSRFDPAFAAERTPLLRDVLELTRDRAGLLIELKYYGHDVALEQRVADLVDDAGMAGQVAVMSLKYPAVQKMRALRPDWRAGVLAATAIGDLTRLQGDFIAVSTAMATPRRIRDARRAGKALYVWTVNDPLQMSRMVSSGVDGLITDDPALARQVLEFRAGLSTPERLLLALADMIGLDLER